MIPVMVNVSCIEAALKELEALNLSTYPFPYSHLSIPTYYVLAAPRRGVHQPVAL